MLLFIFVAVFLLLSFFIESFLLHFMLLTISILVVVFFYSFLLLKTVEQVAMVKKILVSQVTEGDWVAEDVIVNGKTIVSKKDLGVSKEQLELLNKLAKQKKLKFVNVKYGIPFVPSFLIAFVVAIIVQFVL